MAVDRSMPAKPKRTRQPPATTREQREDQLVAAAVDLAERQLNDGTASAQVITHFLKMGSSREVLERQILEETVELKKVQREQIKSAEKIEALFSEAINAFRAYSGNPTDPSEDDEVPYDG